ncbi:MAG: nickel insertion protein [Adlercreutzia equolifaciens]
MTKLLYLECTSGISGDMCAAALLDAGASEEAVRRALESLPVEGFAVEISRVKKSGLDVCDFSVVLDAAHENHDHDMAYLHGQGAQASTATAMTTIATMVTPTITTMVTVPPVATTTAALRK